jgi:hypothetical protein
MSANRGDHKARSYVTRRNTLELAIGPRFARTRWAIAPYSCSMLSFQNPNPMNL